MTGILCRQLLTSLRILVALTIKRLRRSSLGSVYALLDAIKAFLADHNQNPRVFVWSAPVERNLAEIVMCKEVLDAVH